MNWRPRTQQIIQQRKTRSQYYIELSDKKGLKADFALFLVLFLALFLAACGGDAPKPQATSQAAPITVGDALPDEGRGARNQRLVPRSQRSAGAITVAILLPLGHENKGVARTAQDLLDAAQLAMFDTDDIKLHLIVKDTSGKPAEAARAASQAIEEGAQIIIGPLFGTSTQAIAPIVRAANIPTLSFSNDRANTADGVWLLGFLPEQNIAQVVMETVASGRTRFAALIPENAYGARVESIFPQLVAEYGGELVRLEYYPAEAKAMFDPVKRLANYDARKQAVTEEKQRLLEQALDMLPPKTDPARAFDMLADAAPELVAAHEALEKIDTLGEVPFDAVFMPEGGFALRNLSPLLPYFDVNPRNVKFIGTGLWDDASLSREPSLKGGWFAAPDPKAWARFETRYRANYKKRPRRIATLAYDAVSLVAVLARLNNATPFSTAALTDPNGFRGVDGIFRLTPDGLNERGLAVQEIGQRRNLIITPAPASFVEFERQRHGALMRAQSNAQVLWRNGDASEDPIGDLIGRVNAGAPSTP